MRPRLGVYAVPAVKRFTMEVQQEIRVLHFQRTGSVFGRLYEYVAYLLHVRAGYLPAQEVDREVLEQLDRVLSRGKAGLGG